MGMYFAGEIAPLKFVSACMQLVSVKTMRLRVGSAKDGAETSLMGNDMLRLDGLARLIPHATTSVVSLISGLIGLLLLLGPVGLAGFGLMVVVLLTIGRIAKCGKRAQIAALGAADARVNVMREIVEGHKVVKMQIWEEPYLARLEKVRSEELKHLLRFRALSVLTTAFGRSSPMVGASLTFMLYSVFHPLSPEVIFPALSIFQSLRLPFILLPIIFNNLIGIKVSIKRVSDFLSLPEQPPRRTSATPDEEANQTMLGRDDAASGETLLAFDGATLGWPDARRAAAASAKRPATDAATLATTTTTMSAAEGGGPEARDSTVLRGVDLHIRRGECVALMGPVGTGKSSLLASAWGEAPLLGGELRGPPAIGIVPQRAFTITGTLRENIVMGRSVSDASVWRIVSACALDKDLELMPGGLETEVGERGVTLSGGQQQRISLARALLAEPELLLLDDPLSAVDAATQSRLLQTLDEFVHRRDSCGSGAAERPRAALVSLNQPHLLHHAFDRCLTIDEGGGSVASKQIDAASLGAAADGGDGASMDDGLADGVTPPAGSTSGARTADASTGDPKEPHPHRQQSAAPQKGLIVHEERKKSGGFGSGLALTYFGAMGIGPTLLYFASLVVAYGSVAAADTLLALWSREESAIARAQTVENATAADATEEQDSKRRLFNIIYAGLSGAQLIGMTATSLSWAFASIRASRHLHQRTARRLIFAPMWWYDANPSGRTMSRFTSDLQVVEAALWQELDAVIQLGGFALVSLTLATLLQGGLLVVPALIILAFFSFVLEATDRASREVKRLANNAMSPILSTLNEMRVGSSVIRAIGVEAFFATRQRRHIEEWSGLSYHQKSLNKWGEVTSSGGVTLLTLATGIYLMATREEHDPALAGLALTYAYVLPYYVSIVAALYTGARTSLTALERLLEFLKLPQEPPQVLEPEVVVSTMGKGPAKDATWPPHGRLEFRDVSVRYQPGLPLVLDTVSFVVNARQRCGIVGRTGAGKSTLMLALFRLIEPAGGSISIDGVNLLELGLAKARSCTTIIPQEPVLFKGTIKHNIDPFGESSDAAMVDAIRRARLPAEILDVEVDKGGTNLSAGERQLLCFARAMLQPRRLLVLDEATSNLDRASDAAIQELVRSEFESSTLLTIAHRLVTIIDYHKILVMGGGKILEHGPPLELLDTPGSVLAGFVEALGDTEAARLRAHANGSAAAASCASGGG